LGAIEKWKKSRHWPGLRDEAIQKAAWIATAHSPNNDEPGESNYLPF
jgi:hypothetical protein